MYCHGIRMKIGKSSVRVQMTFAQADIDADPHQTVSKRHRWIAALAQILTRWRTREGRERIVLVRGDTSIVAYKRVGQGMTQLSQRTLSETAPSDPYRLVGKSPSVIRLDCDEVLHQKLTLPPDTLDIIRPIVANQLERIMPWEEDEE